MSNRDILREFREAEQRIAIDRDHHELMVKLSSIAGVCGGVALLLLEITGGGAWLLVGYMLGTMVTGYLAELDLGAASLRLQLLRKRMEVS